MKGEGQATEYPEPYMGLNSVQTYRKPFANNLRTGPHLFKPIALLLLLFLRGGKECIHILFDGLLCLGLCCLLFQIRQLGFHLCDKHL